MYLVLSVQGKENVRTFVHIACEVGAYEAEEVGVEHLLRDINDPSVSTLAGELRHKLVGLRGLAATLQELSNYLTAVLAGKLPVNNDILYHVQTILAMLPNVHLESVTSSLFEATNDQHLVLYVASLTRSVLALHDLVANKLKYKDEEEVGEKKATAGDSKENKEKEGVDATATTGKAKEGESKGK